MNSANTCGPLSDHTDRPRRNEENYGATEAVGPTPSRGQNKIRDTTIHQVNHGYIVNVGCHTFALSTKEELLTKLIGYINDPDKVEENWHKTNSL